MEPLIVNSDVSLQTAIGDMRDAYASHRYLAVSWRTGMKRSLDQNGQSHVWYAQLARELRDDDELGWKCYCKLHHGVPILRAEDPEFREFYDTALKGLSYERKLQAMKYLPVTSLMTKPQLTKYLKEMQDDFRPKGVELLFQDDQTPNARPARNPARNPNANDRRNAGAGRERDGRTPRMGARTGAAEAAGRAGRTPGR